MYKKHEMEKCVSQQILGTLPKHSEITQNVYVFFLLPLLLFLVQFNTFGLVKLVFHLMFAVRSNQERKQENIRHEFITWNSN